MSRRQLHARTDLQVVASGTAAGNLAMVQKQLRSVGAKTWSDLASAWKNLGVAAH